MKNNEFDKECKYKLYRTIKEILHPTISKKNISNYRIIIDEELMPLRIFYPEKISNLKNIMIFIHGDSSITACDGSYSNISNYFALTFNQLVICLDYENDNNLYLDKLYDKFYKTFKYIHQELIKNNINQKNIILIGDSTGASAILSMKDKMKKDNINIKEEILFYPILSGEYFGKSKFHSINENNYDYNLIPNLNRYYTKKVKLKKDLKSDTFFALKNSNYLDYPKTLIIIGNVDPLIDENKEFHKLLNNQSKIEIIPFGTHGFLKSKDIDIINQYTKFIKENL